MRALRLLLALVAVLGACSFQPGTLPADDASRTDATSDIDNDQIVDDVDNCVDVANTDQRDFDGDAHGDACDACPHVASVTDPDGDGDGVGDACDPRPLLDGDARVIWIAFYDGTDINGWTNTGGTGAWAVQNHKLVQSNTAFALLDSPLQYFDVYFEARLDVVTTANEVGFCGSDVPIGIQYYCCGVYGGTQARAVSAWPGQPQTGDPTLFATAVGDVIDIVGSTTATESQCTFRNGSSVATSATGRGPRSLGTAVFYATVPARYHYAFVVTIGGA